MPTTPTDIFIDPLGNQVVLPKNLCDLEALGVNTLEIYDQPFKVIEAPAIILQVVGTINENYYFRSIGWQSTLLIVTKKVGEKWLAHKIFKNPSGKQLQNLYTKGNKINLIEYKNELRVSGSKNITQRDNYHC